MGGVKSIAPGEFHSLLKFLDSFVVFTDLDSGLADTETGLIVIHKVPTSPEDPSRGVVAGIAQLCAGSEVPRATIDHVLGAANYRPLRENEGLITPLIRTKWL